MECFLLFEHIWDKHEILSFLRELGSSSFYKFGQQNGWSFIVCQGNSQSFSGPEEVVL
jgi:hypothetical protein